MGLIASIHQPNFFPWLGYFHKLIRSDVFVFFDDVQLPMGKNFVTRVLVNGVNGPQFIHPVTLSAPSDAKICEVPVNPDFFWKKKLLKTLEFNYRKATYFAEVFPTLSNWLLQDESPNLAVFNASAIQWAASWLQAPTRFVFSSNLKAGSALTGSERIEQILLELKATHYISGKGEGSLRYIRNEWFHDNHIELEMESFVHPEYPQGRGAFVPGLSILDLLFYHGRDSAAFLLHKPS